MGNDVVSIRLYVELRRIASVRCPNRCEHTPGQKRPHPPPIPPSGQDMNYNRENDRQDLQATHAPQLSGCAVQPWYPLCPIAHSAILQPLRDRTVCRNTLLLVLEFFARRLFRQTLPASRHAHSTFQPVWRSENAARFRRHRRHATLWLLLRALGLERLP